ncbi:dimethylarginine dimethylaminohydrolase family protein [Granulicella arctica]|uniref:dimethylarginine dimethylaminohydrolase family protein n=1 Tax=Granulicella arctica TaxID=940613 RepID=UPI0021DF7E96|nr:arginine deiminase-related protein [Granulicella arctica]
MSTAIVTNVAAAEIPIPYKTAARPNFLMCAPTLYDVTYVINPWMAGNVHASSRDRATAQWQSLYQALARIADIQLVAPQRGSPDMVFTANAGLERNGIVMLSSFFHPERQGEEQHFRTWFEQAGYLVVDLPRDTSFEGEGDALFSTDGFTLWVGYGPRTLLASHARLAGIWPVAVASLHLIDPRFYHLDTCFATLEGGFVLYYPGAFDAASLAKIEAFYPAEKRIVVTEEDALRFACNAVNIGSTIILNRISDHLTRQLELKGFHTVQLDLSEFLKAGGAAKCLVMKLSRTA